MEASEGTTTPKSVDSNSVEFNLGNTTEFHVGFQVGNAASNSGTNTPSRNTNPNVKPALKKDDPLTQQQQQNQQSSQQTDERDKKHLKWDEKAIEEHDQLRGTRMKIDEPNTPFAHYDSGAESDGSARPKSPAQQRVTLSWDVLQTKLDSVAAVRAQFPSSPNSSHAGNETDHSDVEEEQKKEMRRLEFQEHRKRHYNEMELVRKYRQSQHDDDEDDDDGDADVEDD